MDEHNDIKRARELLAAEMDKTLYSFPMWMRLNYLGNTIGRLLSDDSHTEADINWDKANEILTTNVGEYDFNNFKRIENTDDLSIARMKCIQASIIGGVWQKHICKECGEEFVLTYHEVKFYENKGLHIPKRCKACRDKRKVGK